MSLFSRKSYTFKYSLFGIAFGFCFPVFSFLFDGLFLKDMPFSVESFINIHQLNPLHFIIDSAPIFLGIAFSFAGRNLDKVTEVRQDVESYNEELLQQNQIVTQYSHELQAQSDKIKEQGIQVEKLFSDVQASVRTAERLQLALLPELSNLKAAFEEIFVFYKAKDIISGDFYWFRTITLEDKEYKVIIVADCTGHGVPGAIMTIVGYFLLERIIEKEKIVKPDKILEALNEGITEAFTSSQASDRSLKVREGMDASILVIENEQKIYYAGANRPLYFKKPADEAIQIIKGSRAALGGEQRKKEKIFTLNTLDYQKGSQFYLFSDGYPDQFGGTDDKKFGSKRFRQLLNESPSESMSQMHTEIKSAFEIWKHETSQTDDVVVVGIKI
ncbi:Stage II sporulation protein E (SpoIIE) [Bernardetia litoralis DSM 6794]|uniref:Stage II sporulation protein E (SpoIIE) n=1 Tax=Bernardetia litoralis (strain ATCC 23117 / DSM 6794 / NBRC 15988 / NCIMB 1366 / Fx l1 / Sio-4) TaxID=880071 RepID=I4AJ37_BERLS|nr:SpoIIE family protein phosphatase [Bernardetia litoralis]AFM03972.1 Stage II sporulation protein E (SpoIIE) [Bernardetia litoralis DSM 6794]